MSTNLKENAFCKGYRHPQNYQKQAKKGSVKYFKP
jgi:hypothetical protein